MIDQDSSTVTLYYLNDALLFCNNNANVKHIFRDIFSTQFNVWYNNKKIVFVK